MSKIKAIIFDWGGVISPSGTPDEVFTKYQNNLSLSGEESNLPLIAGLDKLKRGSINEDQFWEYIEANLKKTVPTLKRNIWTDVTYFKPNPLVDTFVKKLKSQKYVVGILSNTFPFTAEAIRFQGWYEGYSPVILSSEVKYAKPDIEIYELLLNQLKLNASETIFIDDQEKCLIPAKKLGFHTVKALNPRQIIEDVERIIESN